MGRTSDAKARLVRSGAELMHERGYTAVGVSDVCARAGVNKGSFYHFFPSKQELALAVIDDFGESTCQGLADLVEGPGPPLERLEGFFEQAYRHHEQVRKDTGKILGCPIGNLALEMSTQDDALRRRLQSAFERQVEAFESVLDQAVESGDLEPQDTRRAARAVVAHVEGGVMLAKLADDPGLLEHMADDVLRLVGARRP